MSILGRVAMDCHRFAVCLVLALLPAVTGCGMVVNLIHAGWGHMVPAEFDGLVDKRVAVVCVSNSASFGPRPVEQQLAERVAKLLQQRVRNIEVIDRERIERWIDENEWNQIDYIEVGRGVGAELVVAVDLATFRLHEGQTMYKGRCEFGVTVYDLTQSGEEVFRTQPPEVQFPVNAGQHTTDISERDFRRQFVDVLAHRVARNFYPYDFKDDFARDPTLVGP